LSRLRIWFSRITLDLDQQRPVRQQRPNRVAIEVLDAHFLKPAGLPDAGDAGRIVAVTLIDLHLEYRHGMTRVDTDHPSRGVSVQAD
jgi:hypothetical protein